MALVLDGTTGISGPATGLTGTAPSLTAGNVTNNANLTGVVTSVGNATSWAASTGSGSNVLATSPTLVTPNIGAANATSVAFPDASVQNTAATGFGFKNRIINGDMRIDQRNAGASVTPTTDNTYTLDRWITRLSVASKFSVQQNAGAVTPPIGYVNYLGVTSLAATTVASGDYYGIQQSIEGFNLADVGWGTASAQPVTLSFIVRSSLTGTFSGAFKNSAFNRSYLFTFTINSANTWETKFITIAGDTTGTWLTTNGIGVQVIFNLGYGSTYTGTAGAWAASNLGGSTGSTNIVATSGATFYITGVQLEKGSTATSFDYRDYGRELIMCQRYYQTTGGYFAATLSGSELSAVGSCNVKVDMRADPTATLPSGSSFHRPGIAFYSISSVDSGPQANGRGYQYATIAAGAGTSTAGQIVSGLNLSAEL